jgi:hypothetical protein
MTKFLTNEDISNIFVLISITAESAESEVIKNTLKNFYLEYQDVLEDFDNNINEDITFM